MPIRPTVHRELPASFYKLLLKPRSRDLPSRPRIYQYAHKYPSSQNGDTLNWPYPPFRLGSIPGFLYLSGYERVFMKKRRLGEELRERGHLSTADLNQVLLESGENAFTSANCCCRAARSPRPISFPRWPKSPTFLKASLLASQ